MYGNPLIIGLERFELVVDELAALVVPAVQLTDLCADFLRRMLGSKLSHSLEVNLTACRGTYQAGTLLRKVPSWISDRIFFIAFLVSSVMIFGPVM